MTIGEVEAFLAIYQHRNLSKAARSMYISQPSLSAKLALLEKELDCQLFIRGKGHQSILVTKEGEAFYPLALRYMEIVQSMMRVGKQVLENKLRVCATNSIGSYLLTPACELFMSEHPDIHIEMQDAETEASYRFIETNMIDLALTPIVYRFSKIPVTPLLQEPMVFLCSKHSAYPNIVDFSHIQVADEIYVQWSDTFVSWHRNAFADAENIKVRAEMMNHLQYFLEKKDKWALVPLSVAKGLVKAAGIQERKTAFEIPKRTISCLYLEDISKTSMREEFLRCFKKTVQDVCGNSIEFYI